MNILQSYEISKEFIKKVKTKMQLDKVRKGSALMVNCDFEPNIEAIYYYDLIIKKMCNLEEIIYTTECDDEDCLNAWALDEHGKIKHVSIKFPNEFNFKYSIILCNKI